MVKGCHRSVAHAVIIEKAIYKWRPKRRQVLLLNTDKPLIALYYIALGCLDGWYAYFLSGKTRKNMCLFQNMHLIHRCT